MTDLGEGGRAMIAEATSRYHAAMDELRGVPWRVGRRKPRNVYADTGPDWEDHSEIGRMDSPGLAREAAEAHNAALARRPHLRRRDCPVCDSGDRLCDGPFASPSGGR